MVSRQSLDNARRVAQQCLVAVDSATHLDEIGPGCAVKWLREVVIPHGIKLRTIYEELEKAVSEVREYLEMTIENPFILALGWQGDMLFTNAHDAVGYVLRATIDRLDSIEIPTETQDSDDSDDCAVMIRNGWGYMWNMSRFETPVIYTAIVQEWRTAVRALPKANDISGEQDEASEVLDDISDKQDDAPGSLDDTSDKPDDIPEVANDISAKQSDIPEEFRTLPMSLTDAAMRWFDAQGKAETRSTARLLSRYIKEGKIKYIEVHRQSFIFDKREMAQAKKLALAKKRKP